MVFWDFEVFLLLNSLEAICAGFFPVVMKLAPNGRIDRIKHNI